MKKAKCNKYGTEISDVKTSTGNFKRHLASCNPEKLIEYDTLKEVKLRSVLPIKEAPKSTTTDMITDYIIKFLIIMCSLPYRLVETVGFRQFMHLVCPKWQPINRYFVHKTMNKLANDLNDQIKILLNNATNISLGIDLWSDRRLRSYLGVTAHFLDNNFKIYTIVLALSQFARPHTAETIFAKLNSILKHYNIIENKIVKISTDNGSNIAKAARFVKEADSKKAKSDNDQTLFVCHENVEIDSDENSDLNDSDDDVHDDKDFEEIEEQFFSLLSLNYKEKNLRCFNHTLQLIIKDGK